MNNAIRGLLPTHKSDWERASAIVSRGYPDVAPVLAELLVWIQDCNWLVAHVIAPCLATVGPPLIPEIRRVLQSNDDIWKYWVLSKVVANAVPEVAHGLREELIRIAMHPTEGELVEGASEAAHEILRGLEYLA